MNKAEEAALEAMGSVLGSCIIELSRRLDRIDAQGVYTEDGLRARIINLVEEMAEIDG